MSGSAKRLLSPGSLVGEAGRRGALNPVVLALVGEAFLSRLSSGMIKTAVPLYALLVFGMDVTSVMLLVLTQNVVPLLLRPAFGTLADRYGKKRVFLACLAVRTLVGLLYSAATLPLLFVVSFIRGVADSAKGPSASALIADHTDESEIARAYSFYTTTKSTVGGIGEAMAAFLLVWLIVTFAGSGVVHVNVAVLDRRDKHGRQVEEILGAEGVQAVGEAPDEEGAGTGPRRVLRVERRELRLSEVALKDLPRVVEGTFLKRALVVIFIASTILSALSLLLVQVLVREGEGAAKGRGGSARRRTSAPAGEGGRPNVWSFALLGAALTAPAYMVTGEFFVVLAVKLEVTPGALGWIKLIAETIVPVAFGPLFGWLADRIGVGRVVALRSAANLLTSALFWITPWFVGTALLGLLMGLARGVDEIGKAAFKPTWGAIAAKVSGADLANRSRTMGILEGGVDASDLAFPLISALLLQCLSLGMLMGVRAALAIAAEFYSHALMRRCKI